jgi:hypothetical protein
MRWTVTFVYLSLVAVTMVALNFIFGWSAWLLTILIVLLLPAVINFGVAVRHRVPWTTVLSYLSALSLLAAVGSQLAGWTAARSWFLMVWAVLLLAVAISLFWHPMRKPAWGLFAAFWGVVGVVWLIVIQLLALIDVLTGGAYVGSAAWPIGFVGISILVASATGFGAKPFGSIVDSLGVLTGVLFSAITLATWMDVSDVRRAASVAAAIVYCVWIAGYGWAMLGLERSAGRVQRAVGSPSPA